MLAGEREKEMEIIWVNRGKKPTQSDVFFL